MLIVEVDAGDAAPGSCDVRLVRRANDRSRRQSLSAPAGEVTGVVILRNVTPTQVDACVRAATGGSGSISPELLGELFPVSAASRPDVRRLRLTDREYEVLRMLADGESTRGIAEQLSYSERTVKNIVHDLLVKLNCKTRAHAVALAAQQGVI
jgi:DNA-binding NarL/FixJ family response regulator